MTDFTGGVAVVTGGASGLGRCNGAGIGAGWPAGRDP